MWWNILGTLLVLLRTVTSQRDCSRNEYDRCVGIADPLIKEAHLVFPDNLNDIDLVCRTWNMFVDCLKAYTDNCFTDTQRREFNRAVESPIESVHQMCMQPNYQKEYLQYAPCIKNTVVEKSHCGPHYNLLVEQVEQGDIISKSTLCCSHERFKQCVLKETRRLCDRGVSEGPAARFASQVIDKALRFLQDQCINYIPNSGDCVSSQDSLISYSDRSEPSSVISTASSEVYPWSTVRQEMAAKEIAPSRMPKVSTSSSWLPSNGGSAKGENDNSAVSGSIFPTPHLGSRTRPASYGRSNSWASEPSSSTASSHTLPMFPGISSTPSNFKEHFGTGASWDVYSGHNNRLDSQGVSASPGYKPTDHSTTPGYSSPQSPLWNPSTPTTETWYPAAGNQLNNEVDEPNQLGLKKPPNCALNKSMNKLWLIFLAIYSIVRTVT